MEGFSLGCLAKSEEIFGESISTMGISASIMILTNIVAWPNILENMQKEHPISHTKNELDRAKSLVEQIDLILDFCSALMQ